MESNHSSIRVFFNPSNVKNLICVLPFKLSPNQISLVLVLGIFSLSLIMPISYSNTNIKNVFAQNASTSTNQSSSTSNSSAGSSTNTTGSATTTGLDCSSLPSKIGKNVTALQNPSKDVCDIVILRQTPQIMGHNGTVLNKFLAINSLVEIMKAPDNMSKSTGNSSGSIVIAMGEFGLLQTELKPILMTMSKNNWNVTAVHNHPILEKPPMIFVHWDYLGNLNTLINQVKEIAVLDQSLSQQQSQSQSKSPSGNATSDNPLSSIGQQLGQSLGLGNNK
jgi:hypothetical protein